MMISPQFTTELAAQEAAGLAKLAIARVNNKRRAYNAEQIAAQRQAVRKAGGMVAKRDVGTFHSGQRLPANAIKWRQMEKIPADLRQAQLDMFRRRARLMDFIRKNPEEALAIVKQLPTEAIQRHVGKIVWWDAFGHMTDVSPPAWDAYSKLPHMETVNAELMAALYSIGYPALDAKKRAGIEPKKYPKSSRGPGRPRTVNVKAFKISARN